MTELRTKILHIVSKENIKMIPRWKFVLYSSLGIAGIIFAFLLAIFAGSLILFVLSKYGFMYMSFFDFMAALHALNTIPLVLLFLTVVLLFLIEIISRNYTLAFRRPLGITLLVIISVVVVISYGISQTSMHEYIRDYARTHNIPLMNKAYDRPRPFKGENGITVIRGVVVSTTTTTATIRLFDGAMLVVYGTSTEAFKVPEIGKDVVVFGRLKDDKFEINSIRFIPIMKSGLYSPSTTMEKTKSLNSSNQNEIKERPLR